MFGCPMASRLKLAKLFGRTILVMGIICGAQLLANIGGIW